MTATLKQGHELSFANGTFGESRKSKQSSQIFIQPPSYCAASGAGAGDNSIVSRQSLDTLQSQSFLSGRELRMSRQYSKAATRL